MLRHGEGYNILMKYDICGGPGSVPGAGQVIFMVGIAVEQVFLLMLVIYPPMLNVKSGQVQWPTIQRD
jgi:hypothetical protein